MKPAQAPAKDDHEIVYIPSKRSPVRDALWVAAVAVIYFAAARLGLLLVIQPEGIAAVWPPTGIFLSAILLSRSSLRPALVAVLTVTDFIAEMLAGTQLLVSMIYAFTLAGDAILSSWLLLRFVGEPVTFRKMREVLAFLVLSVIFSNCLLSLLAAAASKNITGTSFFNSWRWWATSDGIGNLLVTPLVLSWAYIKKIKFLNWSRKQMVEGAALFFSMALLNVLVFNYLSGSGFFTLLLPYVTFPFLLWAAIRFGMPGVTTAIAVLAIIAIPFSVAGHAASVSFHDASLDAVITVQLYLAIMAIPSLFLAALVNEHKQAEESLRENELRFRSLVEQAGDGFELLDAAGRYVDVNSTTCNLLGYTKEELLCLSVTDIDHVTSQEQYISTFQSLVNNPPITFETEHQRKDGTTFPVEITASVIQIGGAPHSLALVRDISDRKRAEEEREKLHAQLFQAQKMESVGRLAGGVAHDFNNMLTVILGHAELGLYDADPAQRLHSHLEQIRKAAERSAALTQQLLAFARKQTIAPKVLDLNDAVVDILKMLRRLIGENIDIEWLPENGLWHVKIDPVQIDQLLANLCVNVRDAIAETGRITIETGNISFDPSYYAEHPGFAPGDYVMLAVSDNGCGMAKDVLEHVFEPFFTTKCVGQGTGLGLAMVHGIVKQNEGFIYVYSEPGKGTTFKIYLPRYAGEGLKIQAEATEGMPRGQGECVLLVEDEAAILELCKDMLEQLGYGVLCAGTPGEAIRIAGSFSGKIHLLITDVVMPEMNGRDLEERIAAIKAGIRCLFMSGYTTNVIAHEGILNEGVHFIQKPFSHKDFAVKICEALRIGR